MNKLNGLRASNYNRYYKRFQILLDQFEGKKTLEKTLNLLQNMESPRLYLDIPMTRIIDEIFLQDKQGGLRERYKELLTHFGLNWRKFEIKRLIKDDQYELAMMEALEGYHQEQPHSNNIGGLLKHLHFIELLQMASVRSDTIMLEQLLNILQENKVLTDINYANLLINSINNNDFNTTKLILKEYKLETLSDNGLYQIGKMYVDNEHSDKIYEILILMKSPEWKFKASLLLLESMEVDEGFALLDYMVKSSGNPYYEDLKLEDLPAKFYQIPQTNEFSRLTELLEMYEHELKTPQVKDILLQSILISMGNLFTGFNSNVFVLNYLLKHSIPLTTKIIDILCHNLSKTNLKLTTLTIYDLFESQNIILSERNYYHLTRVFLNGNEPDLLYLFIVRILEHVDQLPLSLKSILNYFVDCTKDKNLAYLLNNKESSLTMFKEMINYSFIIENIENADERYKQIYNSIPGFHSYNYEIDLGIKKRIHNL